jgi:hypothetical protein
MFTITKAHTDYSFLLFDTSERFQAGGHAQFNLIGSVCPALISALLARAVAQGVPTTGCGELARKIGQWPILTKPLFPAGKAKAGVTKSQLTKLRKRAAFLLHL